MINQSSTAMFPGQRTADGLVGRRHAATADNTKLLFNYSYTLIALVKYKVIQSSRTTLKEADKKIIWSRLLFSDLPLCLVATCFVDVALYCHGRPAMDPR